MVRLFLQAKAGPKSTKSCFSYCCCDVLCILHAFEHHKVNLLKHDLSRLERLFSGQFEDLKQTCFKKLITLNSFWGKTLPRKIVSYAFTKLNKKMKITCRQPIKKIYLVVDQVDSSSLIHCSSIKIHNNTYKMSPSVKELTVCQNTFSHVEITAPPVH